MCGKERGLGLIFAVVLLKVFIKAGMLSCAVGQAFSTIFRKVFAQLHDVEF
jgi:hypothetical protein